MKVWLVRHAMPLTDAALAPGQWELSPDGVAAARRLRGVLPTRAVLTASDEPKAARTVREACPGAAVATDAGFGEVGRPLEWVADHRTRARAYVDGSAPDGWEPHGQVVRRFSAAVARHEAPGRDLVIGTHGMAGTLWLAAQPARASDGAGQWDAGAFWAALQFPDVIVLDRSAGTWSRPA